MADVLRYLGNIRGARGLQGVPGSTGLPGVNAVPTDEAIATYVQTLGTQIRTAFDVLYAPTQLGQFELQPMVAIGHSYIGQDNQTVGGRIHERVASRLRMGAITELGAPGQYSRTVAMNTMAGTMRWAPRTRAMFFGLCTINDIQLHGSDARAFTGYQHAWRALLSFVTARAAIPANSDVFVYSPSWSRQDIPDLTLNTSTGGQYLTTSAIGEYFEFTYNGDAVDVVMISRSVPSGVVTFTAGGSTLGTLDMTSASMEDTPTIFRVRGLGAGDHTVRGTLTSGASATVDSIRIPSATPVPGVVVGEALPNRTAPSGDYATLLERNKAALAAIVAEFPSLVYVDASPGWVQSAMLTDNTHPNDAGAAHYANLIVRGLAAAPCSSGLNVLNLTPEGPYASPPGPAVPVSGFRGTDVVTGGTFRDNFDGPDSVIPGNLDTGEPWVILGSATWGQLSGAITPQSGGTSVLSVNTGAADGTVSGKVGLVGGTAGINSGLAFRVVDEGNFWYTAFGTPSTHEYALYARNSGSPTLVAGSGVEPQIGDVVEVVLAGASIIVKVNGVQVISHSSANRQTATIHGVYGSNGAAGTSSRWTTWKFTP